MPKSTEMYLKVLEAAGLSREEAIAKLEELMKDPAWGAIPIVERAHRVISELVLPDVISKLLREASEDLAGLVKTGKSKIEPDESALA
jgi:hypothetical protein